MQKTQTKSTCWKDTRLRCSIQYYRWSKPKVTVPKNFSAFIHCFDLGSKFFVFNTALTWNSTSTLLPMLILSSQLDCISHEMLAIGLLWYVSAEGASEKMEVSQVRKNEQKRVCHDGWDAKILVKHLNKKTIITCSHLWLQRIGWWLPPEEKLTG